MIGELAALAEMSWHARCSREQIVAYQGRQLRRLVSHAYHNVPYYRRLFDKIRLKPQDIRDVNDLGYIPITCKADLQTLPLTDRLAQRGQSPLPDRSQDRRLDGGATGHAAHVAGRAAAQRISVSPAARWDCD